MFVLGVADHQGNPRDLRERRAGRNEEKQKQRNGPHQYLLHNLVRAGRPDHKTWSNLAHRARESRFQCASRECSASNASASVRPEYKVANNPRRSFAQRLIQRPVLPVDSSSVLRLLTDCDCHPPQIERALGKGWPLIHGRTRTVGGMKLDDCADSRSEEIGHWGHTPTVSLLASVDGDRGLFLMLFRCRRHSSRLMPTGTLFDPCASRI
jgi:hypothetical protein